MGAYQQFAGMNGQLLIFGELRGDLIAESGKYTDRATANIDVVIFFLKIHSLIGLIFTG
jgi:hypothetical protein